MCPLADPRLPRELLNVRPCPSSHLCLFTPYVATLQNAGLRTNQADYVLIEDNEIYDNTFWSSNAESGLVIADSVILDHQDTIKMIVRRNKVHGNMNKIS